ncbi:hypothetical protein [Spiroplasma taiwanense]|nr:hypothetical protein [Spiroplasma taiwanense]
MFFDKASSIIIFIASALAVLFGFILLAIKSGEQFIIYYNYYFLFITGIIWIILIMRLVFLFMYSKIEDKTIYIISTQTISRSKIFLTQTIALFTYVSMLILTNFLIINIFALITNLKNTNVILNATLVHMIYLFLISYLLINFFTLLSLFLKNQITTIIITLILALSFIASLPYQFISVSEKNENLYFTSPNGNLYVEKIEEIYKAFDLQEHIKNEKIKYKYLSKFINDFFIINNFLRENSNWTNQATVNARFNFWEQLDIIENTNSLISANNLTISKLPTNWSDTCNSNDGDTCIKLGDSVNVSITQKNKFITLESLKTLVDEQTDDSKKLVLNDLYNFSIALLEDFSSTEEYQNQYYKWYGDLLNFDDGQIKLSSNPNVSETYTKTYLVDGYRLHFVDGINSIGFIRDANAKKLFNEILYDPLYIAIRVLEQYFINYTSTYITLTNYSLDTSKNEWINYKNRRNLYNTFFYLNSIANMFSLYTKYSGESWDDIWFNNQSDSYIILSEQHNLFLSYSTYYFDLDETNKIKPETYNNFVNPYYFAIAQLIIALFNNLICLNVYKKKDFV